MTVKDISEAINVNRNSTAKYLDVMLISGELEQRTIGMAKMYYRSHRTPTSALLDFSSDSILVINKELVAIHVNKNFLDLFNLSRDEIIGKNLNIIPDFASAVKGYLIGEDSIDEKKDIEILDHVFRVKLIPTVFNDGSSGTSIIMEDVTEEKKLKQIYWSLRRSGVHW